MADRVLGIGIHKSADRRDRIVDGARSLQRARLRDRSRHRALSRGRRRAEGGLGFGVHSTIQIEGAEPHLSRDDIRRQRDSRFKGGDRLVLPAQSLKDLADTKVGAGKTGIERQRSVERCRGLFELPRGHQGYAEVMAQRGHARPKLDSPVEQLDSLSEMPVLDQTHALGRAAPGFSRQLRGYRSGFRSARVKSGQERPRLRADRAGFREHGLRIDRGFRARQQIGG